MLILVEAGERPRTRQATGSQTSKALPLPGSL